jgi:hypothetical protein
MPDGKSQRLRRIRYDERRESWFLAFAQGERLVLDRASLARLISLYNEIHRGNPLTLVERHVIQALGRERDDLQATVQNLYDFIDREPDPPRDGGPHPTGLRSGLLTRLRDGLLQRFDRIRVS